MADTYGLPLGLVAIAAGLGWLVLRLWPDAPDADDGARSATTAPCSDAPTGQRWVSSRAS